MKRRSVWRGQTYKGAVFRKGQIFTMSSRRAVNVLVCYILLHCHCITAYIVECEGWLYLISSDGVGNKAYNWLDRLSCGGANF